MSPRSTSPLTMHHLSPTQLTIFSDCGLRWAALYQAADRRRMPATGPMLAGRAIDEAISHYYRARLLWGEPTDAQLLELAHEVFRAGVPTARLVDGDERLPAAFPFLLAGFKRTFSQLEPADEASIQAEVSMELPYAPGQTIRVIGYIDLVTADETIVDFKTSGTKKPRTAYLYDFQLTSYAAMTGLASTAAAVLYTKKYPPELHVYTRSAAARASIRARYQTMARAIAAGILLPANKGADVCSPFMCPVYDTCQFGRDARGERVD